MTQSLPQVAHEHHAVLLHNLDAMPAMADSLLAASSGDAHAGLNATRSFLEGTLLPHLDAAEATIYPELERMFQNRHSMAPMRREHAEIRRLVAEFGAAVDVAGSLTLSRTLSIRRIIFQRFALLKVHLAEEKAYIRILERGVAADVSEILAAALAHPVAPTAG